MLTIIRHAALGSALVAGLLAMSAGPTFATGAEVIVGRASLDGVSHDFMICGWEATFTASGQAHWTVTIASDHHFHFTFQESGQLCAGHRRRSERARGFARSCLARLNMISFATNVDPASEREVTRTVQTAFEGPFRGQIERITLVVAADGTVRVDRFISDFEADCESAGGLTPESRRPQAESGERRRTHDRPDNRAGTRRPDRTVERYLTGGSSWNAPSRTRTRSSSGTRSPLAGSMPTSSDAAVATRVSPRN